MPRAGRANLTTTGGLGVTGTGLADALCSAVASRHPNLLPEYTRHVGQLDVTRDLIDEKKGGYYTPLPT
ncbi:hypothetical protein ABZ848_35445 [Streptomyces sp. NPDC047081]|uniref:hypothetical protein n=1 Tax=Streptomyces sp. NPDC047081 TaxID=3154706 RepID=UPI0033C178B6